MSKKLHVDCFFVEPLYAEAFRHLATSWGELSIYAEAQAHEPHEPPTVEILYEETSDKQIGRFSAGTVGFDLWFSSIHTAFYFGQAWERRLREETMRQALDVRTRLEALRDRELHLVLKDGLHGLNPAEAEELGTLAPAQEDLFPLAAQVLGWDWAALTAPGRLRLATPNQAELMLRELTKLLGGLSNG
jgi:hypothetical protein